ncbi:MAG: hypothetical protein U9Q34_04095 [Elusimicrobiota bacterium]|nr:hypothetical protein [Elusimicrobiota bacterium]
MRKLNAITKKINFIKSAVPFILMGFLISFSGCFGGFKRLKVLDYTNKRVTDLTIAKKVTGKKNFLFFSKTKTGIFLEGNIQGMVTDYKDNPIEGVTVRAITGKSKDADPMADFDAIEENANSYVNLSFTPGISDSQGLFKIQFSLPVIDDEVDVEGKIIYNPGWQQQKINLGKTYEPQMKESSFRLYYNLDTGFLAFAEGIRNVIVQPIGEGKGRMEALPGSTAPAGKVKKPAAGKSAAQKGGAVEDLFEGFDFGN